MPVGPISLAAPRPSNDFLPHAVIELLLRDGNWSSLNFERVIFCVEILDTNEIAIHGHQGCRELFDFGALRSVALHWDKPVEQLSGHWREDHLFSLRQGLKMYDAIQERITDYEKPSRPFGPEFTAGLKKAESSPTCTC